MAVRNKLQVKSVRLSASLKFEKWAHICKNMGKAKRSPISISLGELNFILTYMCSLRHPSKILKVQHSIWELRITTAQQEMYNNLGAFRD